MGIKKRNLRLTIVIFPKSRRLVKNVEDFGVHIQKIIQVTNVTQRLTNSTFQGGN